MSAKQIGVKSGRRFLFACSITGLTLSFLPVFVSPVLSDACIATANGGTAKKPSSKKPVSPANKPDSKAGGNWSSEMSDMMNQIESEVGSGKGNPPVPSATSIEVSPPGNQKNTSEPGAKPSETKPDGTTGSAIRRMMPQGENYLAEIEKTGLARWNKMPIKVYIQEKSSVSGFRPEFVEILKQAFSDWADLAPELVSFEFVQTPLNAQIICSWTDKKDDLMANLEGGNTVLVPEGENIRHADMKILTLPPKDIPSITEGFMERVALHEAGHALGLTGHSSRTEDIMFGIIYPKEEKKITERDKNTFLALYNADSSFLASHRIDASKAGVQGDTDNPKAKALRLNNEAVALIDKKKFEFAISKLEEAHKLDPSNNLVSNNLAGIYANYGSMAGMTFNFAVAATYFKKAIPLLEATRNKSVLLQVCMNYAQVLRASNNLTELKIIEAKIAKLKMQ